CEAVYRAGLNSYLGPLGFPEVPAENPALRRLHEHTMATDPDRFWLAERDDQVLAFGSATIRPPVWFLSMLFVDPGVRARGRADPGHRDRQRPADFEWPLRVARDRPPAAAAQPGRAASRRARPATT